MFRNNLELEAQIAELRDQIRKKDREEAAVEAVKRRATREDPMKTIVREIYQPQPPPMPVPATPAREGPTREIIREFRESTVQPVLVQVPSEKEANTQLIQALQQAIAHNQDLASFAAQMGLSMQQLIALMHTKLRQPQVPQPPPGPPPGPPPPPPPPPAKEKKPPAKVEVERSRSARAGKEENGEQAHTKADVRSRSARPPEPVPVPARNERSRSARQPEPVTTVAINAPGRSASRQREPSLASTVNYGPSPSPAPANKAASKDDSAKLERSRSRAGDATGARSSQEPLLPIKERGRSPTDRVSKIMSQIAKSQNRVLAKGAVRVQLGKFAQAFARRNMPRAASEEQPRIKVGRTFDEIDEISQRAIPFGASLQKQRTTSAGASQLRYGGRLVR